MDSGETCKVLEIGTIKIKMFNGTVHTLRGVKFVLSLMKNLISVNQLYSKYCRMSVKDGVIKICRGDMVMMKAQKVDNQFRLNGARLWR